MLFRVDQQIGGEIVDFPLHGLRRLVAEQGRHDGVDFEKPALWGRAEDSHRGVPHDRPIFLLAFPERRLGAQPLGDFVLEFGVGAGQVGGALGDQLFESLVEFQQGDLGALALGDLGLQRPVLGLDARLKAIQPELGVDAGEHLFGLVGFGDEIHAAHGERLDLVDRLVGGAEKNHGDSGRALAGFEAAADFVAVDARQVHVEQDQIGRLGFGGGQSGCAVDDRADPKTLIRQQPGQQPQAVAVVIHRQDAGRWLCPCWVHVVSPVGSSAADAARAKLRSMVARIRAAPAERDGSPFACLGSLAGEGLGRSSWLSAGELCFAARMSGLAPRQAPRRPDPFGSGAKSDKAPPILLGGFNGRFSTDHRQRRDARTGDTTAAAIEGTGLSPLRAAREAGATKFKPSAMTCSHCRDTFSRMPLV